MSWWLFWVGYALVPSLMLSQLGGFLPLADESFGLLSARAFILIASYFLIPAVYRSQLNQRLLQRLSGKVMGQVMGVFVGVLLIGISLFTLLEAVFHAQLVESSRIEWPLSVWQLVTIIILAPIVEETWFRHWLVGDSFGLKNRPWFGFIQGWQDVASVVLFGLLHISADYWGIKAFVWASMMGLFLLWVRRYTGSLTACIGLHALHNIYCLKL